MRLTDKDLKQFQEAVQKDYGVKLEGKSLYQAAFSLLKFFESLIKFDRQDKEKKITPEPEVQKSSKRIS